MFPYCLQFRLDEAGFLYVYYQKCEPTKYIYSLSAFDYNYYNNVK